MGKSCFFIGSRSIPGCQMHKKIYDAIKRHIVGYDVTEFTVGQYGDFDRAVAQVLAGIKAEYPGIKALLLTPYGPGRKPLPEGMDGTVCPFGADETVPPRAAIVRANQLMVAQSDYLIACPSAAGNSRKIVEYAQQLEMQGRIHVTILSGEDD